MKNTKLILIVLMLLFLSLAASGCSTSGTVASSWPGILVDGETTYIANNQFVYAIQTSNGIQRSQTPEKPIDAATTFFHKPILLENGLLLAGSYKKDIYTFDTTLKTAIPFFTGAESRWIAGQVQVDDTLYAPNADGTLYAIDLDGSEKWKFTTEDAIWSEPVVAGNTVYLASMDHYLYALNASNGNLLWKTDLGGTAVSAPALGADNILYIGTFNSELVAIDGETGSILWTLASSDWIWGSPVLGADNVLYFTNLRGAVYAVDTTTQEILWQVETDGLISGSVLVVGENLFVATGLGTLYNLDLNGDVLWKQSLAEGEFHGTPVFAGDNLILVSAVDADYLVYAYTLTGAIQWQFSPAK